MDYEQKANRSPLLIIVLTLVNLGVWGFILSTSTLSHPEIYFLDVGQGDAQLIVLPKAEGGSVKILNDAGEGAAVLSELSSALGAFDNNYIDLLIMSHAHEDHYGGYIHILEHYDIGAFIFSGHETDTNSFLVLMDRLSKYGVPILALKEGSVITYLDNEIHIISPDEEIIATDDLNEASITFILEANNRRALFTGDIGFPTENIILDKGYDISADILKVGHHGSRFSSSPNFIQAVSPTISVIGVGKNNRFSHPDPDVIETLELAGSRVYTTKDHGTVRITLD